MTEYVHKSNFKYFCISFLVIIALFRPRTLNLYSGLSRIFYIYQMAIVSLGCFFILMQVVRRGLKAFGVLSYLVIIYKIYELSCIYKSGHFNVSECVNAGIIILATIYTEFLVRVAPREYMGVLSFYAGSMVFINNISYFYVKPSSFTDAVGNQIYFWSTRNHLSSLFFIAFISAIFFHGISRTMYSQYWNIFVLINIIWGTFVYKSATTVVGIAVLLALYVLFKKKTLLYKPLLWFICAVGLNVAIVIFRVQEVFSWLIENILKRDIMLTGRTTIWDLALYYISKSPYVGYGQSSIFNFYYAKSEIPAHNQFLDICIICGIPGMLIFLIILFVAFRKLSKCKESVVGRVLSCALLGYMIMSISESPSPYQPWFIIFALVEDINIFDGLCFAKVLSVSLSQGKIYINRKRSKI